MVGHLAYRKRKKGSFKVPQGKDPNLIKRIFGKKHAKEPTQSLLKPTDQN